MSPDLRDPSDPQSWLRRARSNLARARAGRPTVEVLYEDLCFDAQQAAEKAVKGVLVARQRDFPKTHVVERLLGLVEAAGVEVPVSIREAGDLTRYAAQSRYPEVADETSEPDYQRALELAERVVRWAEEIVGGRGGPA